MLGDRGEVGVGEVPQLDAARLAGPDARPRDLVGHPEGLPLPHEPLGDVGREGEALGRERGEAASWMRDWHVKAEGPDAMPDSLSGGNQQKVLMAKWVATNPRVLLLDEPTRGVDVGAKAEIHRTIRQLADSGLAVLVVSSDLPEVLALADRLLVMREGRLRGELAGRTATEESVMHLATTDRDPAESGGAFHG